MEKLQLAKIAFLLLFLLIIPFVSSSLRPSYLYLLLNILIVALGIEAGFLSGGPREEKKHQLVATFAVAPPPASAILAEAARAGVINNVPKVDEAKAPDDHRSHCEDKLGRVDNPAEQKLPAAEKIIQVPSTLFGVTSRARSQKMRRFPSRPSLFFIGGLDQMETSTGGGYGSAKALEGGRELEEERWEEAAGELSKQELFAKSETFIGNFYKQLKMQREESWKKIHGLYQRAF